MSKMFAHMGVHVAGTFASTMPRNGADSGRGAPNRGLWLVGDLKSAGTKAATACGQFLVRKLFEISNVEVF